jgi:urea transport system substrate-binding protein
VYLWAAAVEAAGSTDVDAVRAAINAGGIGTEAPEGFVELDGLTQHTVKPVRIGIIREDGLIDTVFETEPVVPDPYLCGYEWATVLSRPEGICADWVVPEATPSS